MAEVLGKNILENANLLLLGQDITKKRKEYTHSHGLVVEMCIIKHCIYKMHYISRADVGCRNGWALIY